MNGIIRSLLFITFTVLSSASAFGADSCEVKIQGLPARLGLGKVVTEDVYSPTLVQIFDTAGQLNLADIKFILNGTIVSPALGRARMGKSGNVEVAINLLSLKERFLQGKNRMSVMRRCVDGKHTSVSAEFDWDGKPPLTRGYRHKIRVSGSGAEVWQLSSGSLPRIIRALPLKPSGVLKLSLHMRSNSLLVSDELGNSALYRYRKVARRWVRQNGENYQSSQVGKAVPQYQTSPLSNQTAPLGCESVSAPPSAQECSIRIALKIPYFEIINSAHFTAVNKSWAEEQLLWFNSQVIPRAGSLMSQAISGNGYPMPLNVNQIVKAELLAIPVIAPAGAAPLQPIGPTEILQGKLVQYGNTQRYSTRAPLDSLPLDDAMSNSRCPNTVELWVVDEMANGQWGRANPLDGTVLITSVLFSPEFGPQPHFEFSAQVLSHELGHILGLGHFHPHHPSLVTGYDRNLMIPFTSLLHEHSHLRLEFFQARAAVAHLCGPEPRANFLDLYHDKYVNRDFGGDNEECGNGFIDDREECEINTTKYGYCLDFSSPRPLLDANATCRPDTCTCQYLSPPPTPTPIPTDEEEFNDAYDFRDYLNSCENQAAPACNGDCPEGKTCSDEAGTCKCVEKSKSCAASAAPACGGACPPGEVCGQALDGACACGRVSCKANDQCRLNSDCPPLGGAVRGQPGACAMYKGICQNCRCVYPHTGAGDESTCISSESAGDALVTRGLEQF
jgi:hypothetical protein